MMTKQGSDSRVVNTGFDFEGKAYWYIAEVYYDYSHTPAVLFGDDSCPEETTFEVQEVVIEEVMEILDDYAEIQLNLNVLDKNLQEAIEQDASERAERG